MSTTEKHYENVSRTRYEENTARNISSDSVAFNNNL
jgi:hypothetical protein